MLNISLAFLYNVRHIYPDPNNPASMIEADLDDQETIDGIIKHLKNIVKEVIPIEADDNAYSQLLSRKDDIDLCLNYSIGIKGQDKYAHMPAILELLGIPYTGSGPLTEALIQNKWKMKYFLIANDLPTLPFNIYHNGLSSIQKLDYPLIVKPVAQGSSAGITNESVVHDYESLKKQVDKLYKIFKQPVLVEPFLSGREFSVPLIGNPLKPLPIIEPDFSKLPSEYNKLDSLEVKWIFEVEAESHHLTCPANIADSLKNQLENICLNAAEVLSIKDVVRMDLRLDDKDNPYILDINTPPGIMPPEITDTSYLPLSWRSTGKSYDELLEAIIKSALARYSIPHN